MEASPPPRHLEPRVALGDATDVDVQLGTDLVVTTTYRRLGAIGYQQFSWVVRTPGARAAGLGDWWIAYYVRPGRDTGKLWIVDGDCIGDVAWVRVGTGMSVIRGGKVYADDAQSPGLGSPWKLGPRVARVVGCGGAGCGPGVVEVRGGHGRASKPPPPALERHFLSTAKARNPLSTRAFRPQPCVGCRCWNRCMTAIAHQPHPVTRALAGARDQAPLRGRGSRSGRWIPPRPPRHPTSSRPRRSGRRTPRPASSPTPTASISPPTPGPPRPRTGTPTRPRPPGQPHTGPCGMAKGLEDARAHPGRARRRPGPHRAGRGHPQSHRRPPRRPRPRPRRPRPSGHLLQLAADHDAKALKVLGRRGPRGRPPRGRRRPRSPAAGDARNATRRPPPAGGLGRRARQGSTADSPSTPA